jgi:hypothetical protein
MLRVASETITKRPRPRGFHGWLFAPKRVAAVGRWVHAYYDGDSTMLCGLPLEVLFWEQFRDVGFERVRKRDRCTACEYLAGVW